MRRNNFNWMWIFLFFIIFGMNGVLPLLIIMGIVGFLMVKAVQASNQNDSNVRNYQNRSRQYQYRTSERVHTADQKARVNVFLGKHFKRGQKSITFQCQGHAITLTMPDSARYTSFDSLKVNMDGTYYRTMADFKQKQPTLYNALFQMILNLSQQNNSGAQYAQSNRGAVVDAEIVSDANRYQAPKQETEVKQTTKKKVPYNAETFREEVNALNDDIPNADISNSLYQTTSLLKQLSDLEDRFPDQKPKLKKLYETYLPYLIGILKQYTKMQHVQTDQNYKENEENLIKTIEHINSAMENRLIPSMSESDSINLSADMSTLEAMLKKDGMTDEDDISMALRKTQKEKGTLEL